MNRNMGVSSNNMVSGAMSNNLTMHQVDGGGMVSHAANGVDTININNNTNSHKNSTNNSKSNSPTTSGMDDGGGGNGELEEDNSMLMEI